MPFLGVQPTDTFASVAKQTITGDGSVTYTLTHSVANANDLAVFVNNVRQEPTVAYSATGTSITFTEAIASTDDCYVVYIARTFQTVTAPDNSVNADQLSYPLTNFSSTGIDDNATSTAITINSSQNVSLSNDLTVDTNTLVVDSTNNRVGIGTTVPDRQLQVESTTAATFALATTKNSNSGDAEYSFGEFDFLTDDSVGGLNTPVTAARIAARAKTDSSVPGGELAFYTNISGAGQTQTPFERMRILSSGGITFNGDTAAANALDDYEEGSFAADIRDGTNSVSIGTGYYTKVGNMVTCAINGYNQNISSLNTSHLRLGGLPFNASTNGVALGRVSCTNFETAFVQVINANNYGFMYGPSSSGANVKSLVKTDFASATAASLWITVSYRTA